MKTLFGICFLSIAGFGSIQLGKNLSEEQWLKLLQIKPKIETRVEVREKERLVEIEKPQMPFDEAFELHLPDYKIPPVVAYAIKSKECNREKNCVRFEPGHVQYGLAITKDAQVARMYAHSWCPMQVMGWWVKKDLIKNKFGQLDWYDLLDNEQCAKISLTILEDCWAKASKFHGKDRIYKVGICYNGENGNKYAAHLVQLVEDAAMEIVFGE